MTHHCEEVFVLNDKRSVFPAVVVEKTFINVSNVNHSLGQLEVAPKSRPIDQLRGGCRARDLKERHNKAIGLQGCHLFRTHMSDVVIV